jgi:hypothetical protein
MTPTFTISTISSPNACAIDNAQFIDRGEDCTLSAAGGIFIVVEYSHGSGVNLLVTPSSRNNSMNEGHKISLTHFYRHPTTGQVASAPTGTVVCR